jgi:hypothetical protein
MMAHPDDDGRLLITTQIPNARRTIQRLPCSGEAMDDHEIAAKFFPQT